MKESVGRSINSSHLEWWEFKTGDIDRLTALGFAGKLSPLGAEMYRLLVAKDQSAYGRSIGLLADRLIPSEQFKHFKLPYSWRAAIAKQVILEFVHPHCRTCNGAGEQVSNNGVLVSCFTCNGDRYHYYSDNERASNIGIDPTAYKTKFANRVNFASSLVSGEIKNINQSINILLTDD